jgi:hypothetical protein
MTITPKPTKRGPKRKPLTSRGKLAIPKPITRIERSYSIHRKQQVLVFLQHHLIPLQKNIYDEWPRQSHSLSGRPDPPEGYRYPNAEETAFYFKIPRRTISDWWKARDNIAKGGVTKQYPPRWPQLEDRLWDCQEKRCFLSKGRDR